MLATGAAGAAPIEEPLRSALDALGPDDEIAVIAVLRSQLDLEAFAVRSDEDRAEDLLRALRAHAVRSQRSLLAFLRERAATRLRPLWIENAIALRARPDLVVALASRPEVEAVRADAAFAVPAGSAASAAGPAGSSWNLDALHAPELWALGATGAGAVVATLDTGVDLAHADLGGVGRHPPAPRALRVP